MTKHEQVVDPGETTRKPGRPRKVENDVTRWLVQTPSGWIEWRTVEPDFFHPRMTVLAYGHEDGSVSWK